MATDPTPAPTSSTATVGPSAAAPPAPAKPRNWPALADATTLVLLLILSFLIASFVATNSDLWTHLAVGKRYSEGKFEFGYDPFSWATEASDGKPAVYWVHHAWLYSWLTYGLYSLAGGPGLVIFKALIFTATIFLLTRIGWSETNRWFVLICVLMAALALGHRIVLQPFAFSALFLTVTLFVLDRVGLFGFKGPEATPSPPAPLPLNTGGEGGNANPTPSAQGEKGDVRWLWYLPVLFAVWANFDAWFILGPILVALCWAATGLRKWLPCSDAVPGKVLGQVVGLSLLACVVNPHHVRVFQLPPELGYLVLLPFDRLGVSLPDGLVAAGRTLKELNDGDLGGTWTLSPLRERYWGSSTIGMHAMGFAAVPLLLLGLTGFTLAALVKPQPGSPALHGARFLMWLIFAVMGLALYRMIPFFALIAAPLTAMTLGEFLHWQQASNAVSVAQRDRGLNLARWLTLPLVILLIVFAWPGVLGPRSANEEWYTAPRRVAWNIRPDPSLQKACEVLAALRERNECGNVFNENFEMGNYMPYFAPGIKYYRDMRMSLYAGQGPAYAKARDALNDRSKPAYDWQSLFEAHQVDQAVAVNLLADRKIVSWWHDSAHWRQRFADARAAVFSWSGQEKTWPADTAWKDHNQLAFGAGAARLPPKGTAPPAVLSAWDLYRDGVGPRPTAIGEMRVHNLHFLYRQSQLRLFQFNPLPLGMCSFRVFCASAVMNGMSFEPSFAILVNELNPADLGWPALPILMVRSGHRSVADNPLDPAAHLTLAEAFAAQRAQEDYWTQIPWTKQPTPAEIRSELRQFQLVASHYTAAQLQPLRFDYDFRLADLYTRRQIFDMALHHMQLAFKGRQEILAQSGIEQKKIDMDLKGFHEQYVAPLDRTVGLRLSKFRDDTAGMEPLAKAQHALDGVYKELNDQTNKVEVSRLGLGKKSLELVVAIDPKTLKERDLAAYLPTYFRLLIEMGQVDVLARDLDKEDVRKALRPDALAHYQMLVAGATGAYETFDTILRDYEKNLREIRPTRNQMTKLHQDAYPAAVLMTGFGPSEPGVTANVIMLLTSPRMNDLYKALAAANKIHNDLYNIMTLRGIAALESGDTKGALAIFETALHEAGDEHFFSERPIALRYRDLLREQTK